jgi:hypothetical protein
MKFQKIQKEYSLFVNEFIAWCESAGVEVHVPASSNVDVRRNENGQIEVRSLFHLARWPFKGASKKVNGNLTALVRTKEVYEDGYFLIKSNVNTLYLKPMKKSTQLDRTRQFIMTTNSRWLLRTQSSMHSSELN